MMIPKIIHYCWVGGSDKPQSVLRCIESWKKYCPDYEIREWNESNYDFKKNQYMAQAYEAKKWGFVPDYARLDIVYEYGGIYVDTDVEFIKPMDPLLVHDAFMGFENTGDGEMFVNCGHGFGAVPHHEIIKKLRDAYDDLQFVNEDGSLNMLASPHYTTQTLMEFGLIRKNEDQDLDHMKVYASDVLCPKNFRTGKLHRTRRTVSIHHFTASWLDEEIRKELHHTQRINKIFGKKAGRYVLYAESVFKNYTPKEIVQKASSKAAAKAKKKAVPYVEAAAYFKALRKAKKTKAGTQQPVLLDTFMCSDNLGDSIIMENCEKQLSDVINVSSLLRVPTHRLPTREEKESLKAGKIKILCGTNILSGHMKTYGLWKLRADVSPYKNTVLMGVGFDNASPDYDLYTKSLLKTILASNCLHSVRDSFAEKMLHSMGIHNVINTGCPTMWGITEELCGRIPTEKGASAVTTLTDYCQDEQKDAEMLKTLTELYETVYFWPQGQGDLDYIKKLAFHDKVQILDASLEAFDEVLKTNGIDYVGTRLHAGIRAVSAGRRSIILAVDDRARLISKDTGLTVIERSGSADELHDKIMSSFETKLRIPHAAIELWKSQF